jgi:hypothetical protein
LVLLLFSVSPGTIEGSGYTGEEMRSARSLLSVGSPMVWSRHGILPAIYDLPFLLAGKLFPDSALWQDRILALRPILLTSGNIVVLFLWMRRLTLRPLWSLAVALTALFSTMLWPYAYIGLEDTQSFFLFFGAYLAFESEPMRNWLGSLGLAVALGCAVSSKATSVFLLPAVAFLAFTAFRRSAGLSKTRLIFSSAIIAVIFCLSAWSRVSYWGKYGGSYVFLQSSLNRDPIYFLCNLGSFFLSPNKGLFLYCPILLMAALGLSRLGKQNRDLLVFTLLALFGLAGGFSLLLGWGDETWGPRYLHSAIAPLMLCFGVAWAHPTKGSAALMASAAALGAVFAFLGMFFFYGGLLNAMADAGQNTLEAIQGDVVWNPIRFNVRLFGIWASGAKPPVLFTPVHHWYYWPPKPAPVEKTIEIAKWAAPLPYIVRFWNAPIHGVSLWYRWLMEAALMAGCLVLAGGIYSIAEHGARPG